MNNPHAIEWIVHNVWIWYNLYITCNLFMSHDLLIAHWLEANIGYFCESYFLKHDLTSLLSTHVFCTPPLPQPYKRKSRKHYKKLDCRPWAWLNRSPCSFMFPRTNKAHVHVHLVSYSFLFSTEEKNVLHIFIYWDWGRIQQQQWRSGWALSRYWSSRQSYDH